MFGVNFVIFSIAITASALNPPPLPYFNISQSTLDLSWGRELLTEPRFDLQQFLCKICDQVVEVSKVYVKNNQVKSGTQLIGFLTDQHYFDEFYESCARKYEQSYAKAGRFLACSTVLEPVIEQLKQILEQQGTNIVNEKKQICYEKGMKLCEEKRFWNILESAPIEKIQKFFQKHVVIY